MRRSGRRIGSRRGRSTSERLFGNEQEEVLADIGDCFAELDYKRSSFSLLFLFLPILTLLHPRRKAKDARRKIQNEIQLLSTLLSCSISSPTVSRFGESCKISRWTTSSIVKIGVRRKWLRRKILFRNGGQTSSNLCQFPFFFSPDVLHLLMIVRFSS